MKAGLLQTDRKIVCGDAKPLVHPSVRLDGGCGCGKESEVVVVEQALVRTGGGGLRSRSSSSSSRKVEAGADGRVVDCCLGGAHSR